MEDEQNLIKINMLKVLKFNISCCLMLMVLSKNLLHIDTPEPWGLLSLIWGMRGLS